MTPLQRYIAEEIATDHVDGLMSRREALRRMALIGVGATAAYRTDLVLTNPDAGQAEVDLRFYGRNGLVVVPGSPGLVIEGGSTRTISRTLACSKPRTPQM